MKIRSFIIFLQVTAISWLFVNCTGAQKGKKFKDSFPEGVERIWIGPQYWANRLQDWQLDHGRVECITAAGNRNLNLLTARIGEEEGSFVITVRLGVPGLDSIDGEEAGWTGFRIGINGQFDDYRDDAIYGSGLDVGVTTAGDLFIGVLPVKHNGNAVMLKPDLKSGLTLKLTGDREDGHYRLRLAALNARGKELAAIEKEEVPAQNLEGGMALVSNFQKSEGDEDEICSWFDDWSVSGDKIQLYPDRSFGPVLFSQYTLSRGIMKMTAQMPPIGDSDGQTVKFQVRKGDQWEDVQEESIDPLARTATFKIENWSYKKDVPYRLEYRLNAGKGDLEPYYYEGVIRKDPVNKEEVVVAAFTGNNDLGFPNKDLVEEIRYHKPDLLFFSGDQIYEGVAGFGVQRSPLDKAVLDYLRKWYLYGWAYGDILRNTPAISIPDDHDMYHGNIWGAGGKPTPPGLKGNAAQDAGGYKMPAEWVNMVQRTQTSHLPDPYDPKPVLQGITVYYTELNYGGISFAIVEDRKFKSAPKPLLPEARINNGWAQNVKWNPVTQGDVAGAKLLGDRQLNFLEDWAGDWSNHTWMKVLLSQTIFANVATLPAGEHHDNIVPKLRILKAGEYPPDDRPVADMDSDGWPQTGRNKAIRKMRKAFALHIAGDQHLGSTIQYGVEEWRDADYAFCVPSISNVWPRRWFPSKPGLNREKGAPRYTGDFFDGFGNRVTVYAVSNPVYTGKKPSNLYDRATGYGIVRFDRKTRDITIECWPRFEEPDKNPEGQYAGWPIKINQLDNYNRRASGWLPSLVVEGMQDPVVRVFSEKDQELVYALRIRGNTFEPRVFGLGSYRLEVGDPDSNRQKVFEGLKPLPKPGTKTIEVKF